MKRYLICAGLAAALLGGTFGDAIPRAEAQAVVAPAAPNTLAPHQQQKLRRMARVRRHHRHRHTVPVVTSTPTTVIAPSRAP